ncbi:hypothetical protein B0E48_15695 [Rhodanobacter sp. C03]|nr:hypothetical protein B0E48_15695 [Rhodanobacter sp. C03]
MAVGLGLLAPVLSAYAQNLIPDNTGALYPLGSTARGALGRPHTLGRLFVQLDVVPTCTFETGEITQQVLIRCTRGVPYRMQIRNDADAAFGLTRVFAPSLHGRPGELVRIEAQRLDVEF